MKNYEKSSKFDKNHQKRSKKPKKGLKTSKTGNIDEKRGPPLPPPKSVQNGPGPARTGQDRPKRAPEAKMDPGRPNRPKTVMGDPKPK